MTTARVDLDGVLRMVRRLQDENAALADEHLRAQRDNEYLRKRVDAAERHHATVLDGVSDDADRAHRRIIALERELAAHRERETAQTALVAAAARGDGASVSLDAALAHAIHAHPDLFAQEAYQRERGRWEEP